MTQEEIPELKNWSAEFMEFRVEPYKRQIPGISPPVYDEGFEYWSKTEGQIYWHPDTDLNQTFQVVERMRELGWLVRFGNVVFQAIGNNPDKIEYFAEFYEIWSLRIEDPDDWPSYQDINPALAILKAAKATEIKVGGDYGT